MRSARRPAVLAGLAPLVLAAACGAAAGDSGRGSDGETGAEIVIGAPWPWEARSALGYSKGLDMAVAEINGAGGVLGRPLRIKRVDDRESVAEGRLAAQQLAEDREVVAVIGHLQSYVSVPAAAIYDMAGLVMIAPTSTDPRLTSQGYRSVFRLIFTDPDVGRQLADYAASQGRRRAAIYYIRNDYGRGLANAFEERCGDLGLVVVDRQSHDAGTPANPRRTEEMLRDWMAREVDVVLLATEPRGAADLLAVARAIGFQAAALGADALGTPEFLQRAGAAAEGTIIAAAFHQDESRPEVARFVGAYRERFGETPDAGAALAYDAVGLLAHAIRTTGSAEPARIAEAIRGLEGWRGVTGEIRFDEKGDLVGRRAALVRVENGDFTYLPEGATAAPAERP